MPVPRGLIKVCGVRSLEDVQACVEAGVDMIGLVMVPGSKRQLLEHQALVLRERIAGDARWLAYSWINPGMRFGV